MTVDGETVAMEVDVAAAARELVTGLLIQPWGQVSASVYETARLVTLAPRLVGHAARLRFLLAQQGADGGWGPPDGYALVPSLSATEALLATPDASPDIVRAAERGLARLFQRAWGRGALSTPDLPAVELIVPALTELLNAHLDRLGWRHFQLPAGMSGAALPMVRARVASGAGVPQKLLHAWEIIGGAGGGSVRPSVLGSVGASPAATAAWLRADPPAANQLSWSYLAAAIRQHDGPVPCATPISIFERAWSLCWLAQAGIQVNLPGGLLSGLESALGPDGTPAGAGLPPDADTTSVALYALALHGRPRQPDCLGAYATDGHFCTWPGENGVSVTVNAHVLEAFGAYLASQRVAEPRYAATVRHLTTWLRERQDPDGSWEDRWHVSPYYATVCCVLALERFGAGPAAAPAVDLAADWVLATQRADGSWGRWAGTAEETAYAVQILLTRSGDSYERAAARGYSYLRRSIRPRPFDGSVEPAMWVDKDLYLPVAIVRAAILAALHQAQRRPGVVARALA